MPGVKKKAKHEVSMTLHYRITYISYMCGCGLYVTKRDRKNVQLCVRKKWLVGNILYLMGVIPGFWNYG